MLFHNTKKLSKVDKISSGCVRFKPLIVVPRVFFLFGIDIDTGEDFRMNKTLLSCIRICGQIIWTYLALDTMYIFCRFKEEFSNYLKVRISKRIWEFGGILVWLLMFRSRRKISAVVQEIRKLKEECEITSYFRGLISLTWVLLAFVGGILGLVYDESKRNKYFNLMTFGFLNLDSNAKYLFFYFVVIVYAAFMYVLPCCVVLLYATLCASCEDIIKHHVKRNLLLTDSNQVKSGDIQNCFIHYRSVVRVLQAFESSLSLMIFVIVFCCGLGMFQGLIRYFKAEVMFKTFFLPVYSFLSFSTIYFFADKVNGADSVARQTNSDVLQLVSSPVDVSDMVKFSALNNGPNLVLTAWNFFELNRSSFLATIGCILTYSFLILSI